MKLDREALEKDVIEAHNIFMKGPYRSTRGLAMKIGINERTLRIILGRDALKTKGIGLLTYALICKWLGCSLYKYLK